MGGDAFPNTKRLSEEEYVRVCEQIVDCLRGMGLEFIIPVEVKDKAEICRQRGKDKPYGDVDIIVARKVDIDTDDVVMKVIDTVDGDPKQILQNDSTFSFLTSDLYQVDLKFCDVKNLHFMAAFKSNNDFGALLGHLLTPLHLKWSESGLMLKLKKENVSGVGAVKADFLLTNNMAEVCDFLGLPQYCLDSVTRLSCREIFEVLSSSRVFFNNDYDEKYKIRERRKKRPVSDTFFNYLETEDKEVLSTRKLEKYKDDEIVQILTNFREGLISADEYWVKISEMFNLRTELESKLCEMESKLSPPTLDPKFNHKILSDWFPDLSTNQQGKLFGKLKSKYSGSGPDSWSKWIQETDIEHIREQAFIVHKINKSYLK